MDEMPRQKLVELISRHGPAVIDDQRRCEGLLRDYLGAHKRELKLIIMALEEDIPRDIFLQVINLHGKSENQQISKNMLPKNLLLANFSQRLIDNLPITTEAAQWTVETWALALNFIFQEELSGNPIANPATPATKTRDLQPIVASDGRPTLIVARFGGGQYKTIGEALKAAAPGTRILIKPGLYKEVLVLDKAIEIIGDGQTEEIVIEAEACIKPLSDQIRFQNVTLRGSFSFDNGKIELLNCQITGGVKVSGDSSDFIASKSKINRIDIETSTSYFEECDISISHVSASSNITFVKSSLANIFYESTVNQTIFSQSQLQPKPNSVFDTCKIGLLQLAEGNSHFTNCTFISPTHSWGTPAGEYSLVKIASGGSWLFENCDFSGHGLTPVIFIHGKAAPVFRRCKIHNSTGHGTMGMYFGEDTEGLVDECEIYINGLGIEIVRGANPTIRASKINRNSEYGIFVHDNGAGFIVDCDLTNNKIGAFKIAPGCFTRRENNKE